MDSEKQEQEQERDMINVVFGSRVRYGDGTEVLVTCVCNDKRTYPIRTGRGIWHRKDGTCCVSNRPKDTWDIVEIITSTPTKDDIKAAEVLSAMAALTGLLAHSASHSVAVADANLADDEML